MPPSKPKKPCTTPGCPNLTDKAKCQEHEKQQLKHYNANRLSATQRGYDHRWHKIRQYKLNINPLCERCEKVKHIKKADLVHHKDRDPKNNDLDNLESLCVHCHDIEHKDERFGK